MHNQRWSEDTVGSDERLILLAIGVQRKLPETLREVNIGVLFQTLHEVQFLLDVRHSEAVPLKEFIHETFVHREKDLSWVRSGTRRGAKAHDDLLFGESVLLNMSLSINVLSNLRCSLE